MGHSNTVKSTIMWLPTNSTFLHLLIVQILFHFGKTPTSDIINYTNQRYIVQLAILKNYR